MERIKYMLEGNGARCTFCWNVLYRERECEEEKEW